MKESQRETDHRGSHGCEEEKLFEREKVCYEQSNEHLRSLNQIMWQLPLITMTITGASWYAVASLKELEPFLKSIFLVLIALVEFSLCLIILRVRQVMEAHMQVIQAFHPARFPRPVGPNRFVFWQQNKFVARCYATLMAITALASAGWAGYLSKASLRFLICG